MRPTHTATDKPHQTSRAGLPHNNEKGFVLILCMVMLAVLTILGLMVLTSTDTELSITTNTRMAAETLSAAITVQELAQTKILDQDERPDAAQKETKPINPEDVINLLPPGTSLRNDGINEISGFSGPASAKMRARFSADASGKGNIFYTTGEGSGGNDWPYYRSTIETQKQRATARLEAVQIDLTR
ncbi:pilus assembly PilX family protein [Trichloromonas sp.]|uniref:pilus assembly PilX family protein n=1 Tax=Trichloromonas sp. TaxID=3069249 RepID=UPI002A419E68|nr:hypothetical protein [Trichloromonas sp.]